MAADLFGLVYVAGACLVALATFCAITANRHQPREIPLNLLCGLAAGIAWLPSLVGWLIGALVVNDWAWTDDLRRTERDS